MPSEARRSTRVKTGCLTCRRKHRKCDELRKRDKDGNTKCCYCINNGLDCSWPDFVDTSRILTKQDMSAKRRKPSDEPKKADTAKLFLGTVPKDEALDEGEIPLANLFPAPGFGLDHDVPFSGFRHGSSSSSHYTEPQAPPVDVDPFPEYTAILRSSTEPANISDYASFLTLNGPAPYDIPDTLREFMYLNAISSQGPRSPALTLPSDIPTDEVFEEYFKSSSSEPEPQLSPEQEIVLLKNYVELVGGGLDMFDVEMTFVRTIPTLMKDCDALRYAVLALSSRHLETTVNNYPKHLTLQLYEASLRHLVPGYNRATNTSVIAACVILCVFEMMSSAPKNWRRHLEGCLMLFRSYNIHGFGDPLERAIFWTFIRMDICSAVIGEQHPLVPLQEWLPPATPLQDATALFMAETRGKTLGMHANYMVFLTSSVLHLVLGDKDGLAFQKEWLETWHKLKEWRLNLPTAMRSVYEHEDAKSPFPRIFFTNPHAISSHQMFHMASILLLQNKPRTTKLQDLVDKHTSTSLAWHAKRIVGIAITNCDYGAYCNSIQPLYVAGKIMTSKTEHGILLGALRKVETFTGWSTSWRGKDLIEYWNGEC